MKVLVERCCCCTLTAKQSIEKLKEPLIFDYSSQFCFCKICYDDVNKKFNKMKRKEWSNWLICIALVRKKINPYELRGKKRLH